MRTSVKIATGCIILVVLLGIALTLGSRTKTQTLAAEPRNATESPNATSASPLAQRNAEINQVPPGAEIASVATSLTRPVLATTREKASVTSGTADSEVPLWGVIVPVTTGQHTYQIIKDAKKIPDPLNRNAVTSMEESQLIYPVPGGHSYPRVLPGNRVQLLHEGRVKNRVFLVASWRGLWYGCDEFKPMNAAAEANLREILADKSLGTLRGVVIDPSRRPIGKARVRVCSGWDNHAIVECDSNGRFTVDRLPALPDATVMSQAWGFQEGSVKARVLPGDKNDRLEIQLSPAAVVVGRVVDETGAPVVNTAVAASTEGVEMFFSPTVRTDASGRYTHANLKPGTYDFTVRSFDYAWLSRIGVTLRAGVAPTQIDFTLNKGVSISGHVVEEVAGKEVAVADAEVTYQGPSVDSEGKTSSHEWARAVCRSKADGSFVAEHAPYLAKLRGWATKDEIGSEPGDELMIRHGEKAAPQTLRIEGRGRITGRVVDPEKKPVAKADLYLVESHANKGAYSQPQSREKAKKATTDEKGAFTIVGLPASSTNAFRVEAAGFAPTESGPIPGDAKDPVEIVLKHGGAIAGRVVAGDTKEPLGGVTVRAVSTSRGAVRFAQPNANEITTRDDGTFQISSLPEDTYCVGGFRTTADAILCVVPKSGVEVAENKSSDKIDLLAYPASKISGKVVAGGNPVDKAQVSAMFYDPANSGSSFVRPELNAGAFLNTDAKGEFTASMVPPGKYRVSATKAGLLNDEGIQPTPAPDSPAKPKSFREITVEPGRNAEGIELVLGVGGSLTGVVLDADGKPAPQVQLMAEIKRSQTSSFNPMFASSSFSPSYFNSYESRQTSDASGRFTITGLPLDATECRAVTNPYASASEAKPYPVSASEYVKLTPQKPTAEVVLRLTRGGSIAGTVRDAGGSPLSGVRVMAIAKTPVGGTIPTRAAQTNASGEYKIEGIAAGTYDITTEKDKYVGKRIKAFVLKEGQNAEKVDIVLAVGKTLSGVLVDLNSKKLAGWYINATPAAKSPESVARGAQTGSDGRFKIEGLAEGKVSLSMSYSAPNAFENIALGQRNYSFQSGEITPGDQDQILIVPVGGTLQGRVVYADNTAPVTDARISLYMSSNGQRQIPAGSQCVIENAYVNEVPVSQTDGTFHITGLPVGRFNLNARSPMAPSKQIENVFIDTNLMTDMKDITLSRGAAITGRLIDSSTGKPYTLNPNIPQTRLMLFAHTQDRRATTGFGIEVDAGGTFKANAIPADTNTIYIVATGFRPIEMPVRLTAGETTSLGDLRLISGETIKGKLSGPNGEPANNAQITIMTRLSSLELPSAQTVTNDKGEFTAKGCAPGPARLQATAWKKAGNPWIPAQNSAAIIQNYNFTVLAGGSTYVEARFPASKAPNSTFSGPMPSQ